MYAAQNHAFAISHGQISLATPGVLIVVFVYVTSAWRTWLRDRQPGVRGPARVPPVAYVSFRSASPGFRADRSIFRSQSKAPKATAATACAIRPCIDDDLNSQLIQQ